MYKVVCADCRNECEIPFQPKDDRPVYCNDCFAARKAAGRTFKPTVPSEMPKAKDVTPQDQNKVVMIDWRNEGPKTVAVNEAQPEEVVKSEVKDDAKPVEKKRSNGRSRPAPKKKADPKRRPAPKKRRK
jgi:CxxC-x17-CxxC domain-containing protein